MQSPAPTTMPQATDASRRPPSEQLPTGRCLKRAAAAITDRAPAALQAKQRASSVRTVDDDDEHSKVLSRINMRKLLYICNVSSSIPFYDQ